MIPYVDGNQMWMITVIMIVISKKSLIARTSLIMNCPPGAFSTSWCLTCVPLQTVLHFFPTKITATETIQFQQVYQGATKSFRTESITKYTLTTTTNTRWEATQRVMAAELTKLTQRIAIQLHPVADSCTICSSHSRRPVRKLLDTPSYLLGAILFGRPRTESHWLRCPWHG
jgi:hypothetical protein